MQTFHFISVFDSTLRTAHQATMRPMNSTRIDPWPRYGPSMLTWTLQGLLLMRKCVSEVQLDRECLVWWQLAEAARLTRPEAGDVTGAVGARWMEMERLLPRLDSNRRWMQTTNNAKCINVDVGSLVLLAEVILTNESLKTLEEELHGRVESCGAWVPRFSEP